jgi:hypothetical protein
MGSRTPKPRIVKVNIQAHPHNGEGRPDLQIPDPVNGEMVGGQVLAMRMTMRVRHVVCPWARRQGKTRARAFVVQNEALITSGPYYAGICYPDHTMAAKVAEVFRLSWGDLVKDYRINSEDNDRWIELHPLRIDTDLPKPTWFTPRLNARWDNALKKPNESSRIYFWGAAHPYYTRIPGFPHPFHRVDWDETQSIHPGAYKVVRPMIRDVRGMEMFSGTPDHTEPGNVQFEKWWKIAGDPKNRDWFRMRIPDGTNPYVKPTPLAEARISMTDDEIAETINAKFLSGAGQVFKNLDRVLVLPALPNDDKSLEWLHVLRARLSMPTMEWWVSSASSPTGHVILLSADWARSPKGDYSALTVMDATTGQQLAVIRWRGENFNEQMEAVLEITRHYRADQCHSDSNGMGETMADFLRRRMNISMIGHRFGRNKSDYVRRLQICFDEVSIALIDCEPQFEELKDFSAHESQGISSEKKITYAAALGGHDDMVAALLHLAPTLTIVGRQMGPVPEPLPLPVFDDQGQTTLELFSEGGPSPWREPSEASWQDVVLPPRYRRR